MNKLRDFFWFCSGANRSLLKKSPTEHIKYAGIGATVFFTGMFAVISGGYALYYVFNDSPLTNRVLFSLVFGLVWGAMIFNLDRYIVSSMKKNGSFGDEFRLATPRFVLAAIIAFVISKPLELQIFHTSIEYELEIMKQEELKKQENALISRFLPEVRALDTVIKSLQNELQTKVSLRDRLDQEARIEADGTGGSQKRGAKTIYKLKKADAQKAQAELDSATKKNMPLISMNQKELDGKRHLIDSLKTTIKRGAYDGFDKRLDALGNVAARSSTLSWASWFVMLLFLAIEISPVLVKLLSARGPYDDLLEKHEHAVEVFKIDQMSRLNQKTNEALRKLVRGEKDDLE